MDEVEKCVDETEQSYQVESAREKSEREYRERENRRNNKALTGSKRRKCADAWACVQDMWRHL